MLNALIFSIYSKADFSQLETLHDVGTIANDEERWTQSFQPIWHRHH